MKGLGKYEKLKRFQSYNFERCERHIAAVYLNAIRKDDKATIDDFERFGDNIHKIILNYRNNKKNIEFGFGEVVFDKNGWLEGVSFRRCSIIEIDNVKCLHNKVESFVSPNGKYVYGVRASTSSSGMGSGCSVWNTPYESENSALIAGLNVLIEFHSNELRSLDGATDSDYEDYSDEEEKSPKVSARQIYCEKIIKLAKKAIQDIKTPQLDLFL